jgi:hypothetical protein
MRYVYAYQERTDWQVIVKLLKVGVDPNYQTRWGSNVLTHCYHLNAPQEAKKFILKSCDIPVLINSVCLQKAADDIQNLATEETSKILYLRSQARIYTTSSFSSIMRPPFLYILQQY